MLCHIIPVEGMPCRPLPPANHIPILAPAHQPPISRANLFISDIQVAKMEVMAEAAKRLVSNGQFPIFATGTKFNSTSDCLISEQKLLQQVAY